MPDVTERVTVVHPHPTGVNALERYNRGLLELRRGHRDAAYTAFLEAYQSGQRLDPHQSQQLQDFLRTLRPRRQQPITLVKGQRDGGLRVNPAENQEPGRIDIVDRQLAVKFDRLRTEMLNAVFRAERLKEKKPETALDILEQTMAEVESSELPQDMLSPLLRQLQKRSFLLAHLLLTRGPQAVIRYSDENPNT
ncbi:MAG: hypothetical protein IH917_13440 [Acidobacteria bacterium]|nr:hypothetical protein [Acidobacteriota bacterium]